MRKLIWTSIILKLAALVGIGFLLYGDYTMGSALVSATARDHSPAEFSLAREASRSLAELGASRRKVHWEIFGILALAIACDAGFRWGHRGNSESERDGRRVSFPAA